MVGRGAMVAQRTLDPFILVRIRTPQPEFYRSIVSVLDEDPLQYHQQQTHLGGLRAFIWNGARLVLFTRRHP
jgi:hypothetical protein